MRLTFKSVTGSMLLVGAMALTACADDSPHLGGVVIEMATATATVTNVDTFSRTVTLKTEGGDCKSYKAGKDVVDFDQIKVGDKVRATMVDEMAIYVRPADAPSAKEGLSVALTPKGSKPGAVMTEIGQMTATIQKVNIWTRKVTLLDPSGKSFTVSVAEDVDICNLTKGDHVVVRYTEAMALVVEDP